MAFLWDLRCLRKPRNMTAFSPGMRVFRVFVKMKKSGYRPRTSFAWKIGCHIWVSYRAFQGFQDQAQLFDHFFQVLHMLKSRSVITLILPHLFTTFRSYTRFLKLWIRMNNNHTNFWATLFIQLKTQARITNQVWATSTNTHWFCHKTG